MIYNLNVMQCLAQCKKTANHCCFRCLSLYNNKWQDVVTDNH